MRTAANTATTALPTHVRILCAAAGVVGFAVLTALGAQVAIPLPGTPVPMTLQTFVVLLAGVTLGPRIGLASMAFYVLLGTVGYPIFAESRWGLQTLVGPTGGYLLGFVLAQPILGWLTRRAAPFTGRGPSTPQFGAHARSQVGWRGVLTGILAGNAIIFSLGLIWLSYWLHLGWHETLAKGLWPFLVGDLLKMAVAVGAGGLILPHARRLFGR